MLPMLSKMGDTSFIEAEGYVYEPKLDGIRAICTVNSKVSFTGRRGKSMSFPELKFRKNVNARKCILDGEVVVYDERGNPSFQLLQQREMNVGRVPIFYVAFDILERNGRILIRKSLAERKRILDVTIKEGGRLQKIYFTRNGALLWKAAKKRKLEGVMAKREDGKYYPGKRAGEWLKIKLYNTADCVIIGYTSMKRKISSLALGVYDDGIRYVGKVGTGFTEQFLEGLHERLKKIESKRPLVGIEDPKITWVKPRIVCEVRYMEFTNMGMLRSPSFLRIREDKAPEECRVQETQKTFICSCKAKLEEA